jgi:hypothetical protein
MGLGTVLAVASGAPVPKAPAADPPAYYPTLKGARWEYESAGQVWTEFVSGVQEKDGTRVVTVSIEESGKATALGRIAVSARGLDWSSAEGRPPEPGICLLRLPAKPGETWTDPHPNGARTAVFKGVEKVAVPAGTYQATRVDVVYAPPDGMPARASFWYAAGVGAVKFVVGGRETVLKKFTPAKD